MSSGGRARGWWIAKATLKVLVTLACLALLVPLFTGRPLVSYPVSESMEPTLGPFDVFFIDPYPAHLHAGDIILFRSVTTAEPAVHRIVGGDEQSGFTTKGDHNLVEDQKNIEPPVGRDRILGRVVTWPSGAPVKIVGLGHTLTRLHIAMLQAEAKIGGPDRLTLLAFALAAGALLGPTLVGAGRQRAPPEHPPSLALQRRLRRAFPRGVLGWHVGVAMLVLLSASVVVAVHAAHADVGLSVIVVGTRASADGERALAPGESVAREIDAGSLAFLPTLVLVEPTSAHLHADHAATRVAPWSRASLSTTETAGDAVGVQHDAATVWRYPAILPDAWTLALHARMPGLPDIVLGAAVGAIGAAWLALLGVTRLPVGRELGLREDWR